MEQQFNGNHKTISKQYYDLHQLQQNDIMGAALARGNVHTVPTQRTRQQQHIERTYEHFNWLNQRPLR